MRGKCNEQTQHRRIIQQYNYFTKLQAKQIAKSLVIHVPSGIKTTPSTLKHGVREVDLILMAMRKHLANPYIQVVHI